MRKGWLFGFIKKFAIIAVVFIFVVGCSTSKDQEHIQTIQAYLENEFNGPNEKLSKILDQEGAYPPELEAYMKKHYDPLVADLEKMVNTNNALLFLRFAHGGGYQLQSKSIVIQKVDQTDQYAYNYEVELEYSRNDQTNTATVTGVININDDGKITLIRNVNDDGLLENMR
ncbi:hypothetical protein [Pseudalkalibacillus berkeleyi]|uniref:Lipoprotein n=1 Tax=Pseudalkalibacillus berkeleyi TaxID=1069813 RepID=A0ABS9GXZ4_9BACL|nr:hypothetical protein [Pseudalkalibacillus berkeleyi]MCF6136473.1 hypothetical protein [Pseudalkalibacillus berkeleyi]